MKNALIAISIIFTVAVIMPFLITSLCLSLECQLNKRREFKKASLIKETDEILAIAVKGLSSGGDREWLSRESMAGGLKSIIILQLSPSAIRLIKREYGCPDKWVESRIRNYLLTDEELLCKEYLKKNTEKVLES